MKVLVIDIGGTSVKVASTDNLTPVRIPSGPTMTAQMMCEQVLAATKEWKYDCISVGYPGPVEDDKPMAEPHNLAHGWVGFDFTTALGGKPLRFINDAAMQALGGYKGGRLLFLGLGTGLGSAMVIEGQVVPLEMAHMPYRNGKTFEEYVGIAGLERRGKKKWRESVLDIIEIMRAGLVCDNVLLGGGNAKNMKELPDHVVLGDNSNAILGGLRMWETPPKKASTVAPAPVENAGSVARAQKKGAKTAVKPPVKAAPKPAARPATKTAVKRVAAKK